MTNQFDRSAEMDVKKFWNAVLGQGADKIRPYFKQTTYINWYCINEHFSVEKLNPEFPMK